MRELTIKEKLKALDVEASAVEAELVWECPICNRKYRASPFNKQKQHTCGRRRCVNRYYDRVHRQRVTE